MNTSEQFEREKNVSFTVCYDQHFICQTFSKFQFSSDWGRTALIVVSGRIPIRDFGKRKF